MQRINSRMSSDHNEYIQVFFQEKLTKSDDLLKSFVKIAKRYNIFIHWIQCPYPSCGIYYLKSQYFQRHKLIHHTTEKECQIIEEEDLFPPNQMFAMKKGEYIIQWIRCPFYYCTTYYLFSQVEELKCHLAKHLIEEDEDERWFPVRDIFWMKKNNYFELSPEVKRFVLDTAIVRA